MTVDPCPGMKAKMTRGLPAVRAVALAGEPDLVNDEGQENTSGMTCKEPDKDGPTLAI